MYYKYRLNDLPNEVIIIDQPEDDINPLKLSKMLVKYFDQQRENKQIIFITHNPILVVNLDVDNVIFLCKNSTKLHINSGCLEYEWNDHGESNSILSIIENNLDGGLELIQKRMKIYGQKN
ncbi:hypothetical protein FACS1894166_02790 [Bacilli bacterium]|nr:hypothetical protein FACS1894166_02790 [Bacilli bacterium]